MRHNFRAEKEEINNLPVWVRFPTVPVEYHTERWLKQAGNEIGQTIKVDLANCWRHVGNLLRFASKLT